MTHQNLVCVAFCCTITVSPPLQSGDYEPRPHEIPSDYVISVDEVEQTLAMLNPHNGVGPDGVPTWLLYKGTIFRCWHCLYVPSSTSASGSHCFHQFGNVLWWSLFPGPVLPRQVRMKSLSVTHSSAGQGARVLHIEPCQSAYRANHSTETALRRVQTDLLMAVDKGCAAFLVLLDLSG